jgi:hypothetical protein
MSAVLERPGNDAHPTFTATSAHHEGSVFRNLPVPLLTKRCFDCLDGLRHI